MKRLPVGKGSLTGVDVGYYGIGVELQDDTLVGVSGCLLGLTLLTIRAEIYFI